jgi:hypothetical protein
MPLLSMVLPLEGGSPSAVMVIAFDDAIMLIYGDVGDEDFLKVDKGNARLFRYEKYPALREVVQADGTLHLYKLAAFVKTEKRL